MLHRLFPHPVLSLSIFAIWFMLVNELKLISALMALILAVAVPLLTAPYWPDRPKLRNPVAIAEFIAVVMYDIVKANIEVAKIILFMKPQDIQEAWIEVPVDLASPEAVTLLAGTITMTPGTVSADVSADGKSILVHALHAPDPDAIRDDIKARYESRLKRIFA